MARRLARDGARLSLVARRAEALEETAGGCPGSNVEVCDIRDREAVDRAFASAAAALGRIHALVAVSGIGGPNEPGDDDRWDDLVATNLSGTYWCVRAAQRHLAPGPEERHLVVISSILARIAVPGYTGYSASKAGLLGLVRSLAAELAPENVQVNAICPGWVETAMAWQGIDALVEATG
ncbi:MAG TPA: SDR family oxidoreductase, partial [Gaiellaceae bacterium]|nr:SDR family oxidoreductase [Gaiellaceae bacterium]